MTQRDTSGDAFGALIDERNATRAGANDPPLTLSGTQRHSVHGAMMRTYELLERLEQRTKEWKLREGIRRQRIELGAALALVPAHVPVARAAQQPGDEAQQAAPD